MRDDKAEKPVIRINAGFLKMLLIKSMANMMESKA